MVGCSAERKVDRLAAPLAVGNNEHDYEYKYEYE